MRAEKRNIHCMAAGHTVSGFIPKYTPKAEPLSLQEKQIISFQVEICNTWILTPAFCFSVQYVTDLKECPSEWDATRCNPCANKHWDLEEAASRRRRDDTHYESGENSNICNSESYFGVVPSHQQQRQLLHSKLFRSSCTNKIYLSAIQEGLHLDHSNWNTAWNTTTSCIKVWTPSELITSIGSFAYHPGDKTLFAISLSNCTNIHCNVLKWLHNMHIPL